MKEELVSIIMPTYNCEKFIEETIQSVLTQTYQNWELLIIDDCSSDNTKDIVNKYVINDNRIKYEILETNSGAAIARYTAIKKANGKYIAFLDSDDLWNEQKLEKQIKFMQKNNYYFTYTNYKIIDEDSASLNKVVTGPKTITKMGMYNYCWPGCLTVIYDREKVGLIQIENLKKNNDYAMWLKVIQKANCYLLDEVLASYRIRTGSISNHSKVKLIKYHYILYKDGEKQNKVVATANTIRNLFFGVIKKVMYVREEKYK